MHFSTSPAQCRVDCFKPSGKFYETVAVTFRHYGVEKDTEHPYMVDEALGEALFHELAMKVGDRVTGLRLSGMVAVCLEPYHKDAHPQMIPVLEAIRRWGNKANRADVIALVDTLARQPA